MAEQDIFTPNTTYISPNGKPYPVGVNGRIDFSKISDRKLDLPNLVEVQTDSFAWFIEKGIDEAFKDVFPIHDHTEKIIINYVGCYLKEPEFTPLECKASGKTYARKLYATLQLRFLENEELKESDVFVGDLPMMTSSGTFVVNGAERVIVSQIIRSPGAYFQHEVDKNGMHLFNGEITPNHGTWLQFESEQTEAKKAMYVRIDRARKMPATVIFKALGLDDEDLLLSLFGDTEAMQETLKKDNDQDSALKALVYIYNKLKPGEPATAEGVRNFLFAKFFDDKRYDLGRAGRFKYLQKLGIYERLPGRVLAENLLTSDGEILFPEGHKLTKEEVEELKDKEIFEDPNGPYSKVLPVNPKLDTYSLINVLHVYANDKKGERVCAIIGTDLNDFSSRVTSSDMVACFSYFCNIQDGIGTTDDIDHLGNRRIRCVGELLQNQLRAGLVKTAKATESKMSISEFATATPKSLVNVKPIVSAIKEFFAGSQLSQFMDQVNPLAELTNKRRISALGPGGLTRDRASMEVRDVHYTHYGRICPIESPEGQNIGLINNLACYAKIDSHGFIQTPYRKVYHIDGKAYVSEDETVYLTADDERTLYIGEANTKLSEPLTLGEVLKNCPKEQVNETIKEILESNVVCRHDDDNVIAPSSEVNYLDVSPKQIVSIAAACIPFLDHDDATRALMGANMQRQALPLLRPSIPYVGTGIEEKIAHDAGLAVIAEEDGTVESVDSSTIVVKVGKEKKTYDLQKFARSNNGTCINQLPIVAKGDKVKAGQIIADGPAMRNGELALGQNILVAYMTWHGYNYEDAIIMSERMVKDDVFTTIHIEKYEIEARDTKLGPETITRDIPNVGEDGKAYLNEDGIVFVGAEVKENDILVGKVTPKASAEPTPEEKLLMAIFAEKTKEGRDSSLRVPHGGAGIVIDVVIQDRNKPNPKTGKKPSLPPSVNKIIDVYIAQKRKISEGDKMSGRHGNKGVISRILPVEDMPFMADGTPVDILLSPMGVPSRMNIGQVLEICLGLACRKLHMRVATPVFDGITNEELLDLMNKAGLSEDGKTVLFDGQTGERFAERISVGVQYMIKLVHMVDDKLHARATGPYSLVTQQPLGGKAQNGGQRFGEMEVWALEAYGAAHTLQEMLTIKSDDRVGRRRAYEAIIKSHDIPRAGMPEAFKVFVKEMKGLGLNVSLYDHEGGSIDMDKLAADSLIEERKINSEIRSAMMPKEEEVDPAALSAEVLLDEGDLTITSNPKGFLIKD